MQATETFAACLPLSTAPLLAMRRNVKPNRPPFQTSVICFYLGSATCHVACGYEGMFKCGGVRCWTANPDSCSPGPSTPATDFRCEAGWKRHGDHCFRLFTERLNYLDANNQCIQIGGFLASIKDQEDQDVLFNFAAKGGAWIGGQDFLDEGKFTWLQDGTVIDDLFGNWKTGQPNNIYDNQHCIWMRLDGSWDDVTCKRIENYICQKKATVVV